MARETTELLLHQHYGAGLISCGHFDIAKNTEIISMKKSLDAIYGNDKGKWIKTMHVFLEEQMHVEDWWNTISEEIYESSIIKVEKDRPFTVQEYDGYESIHILSFGDYYIL